MTGIDQRRWMSAQPTLNLIVMRLISALAVLPIVGCTMTKGTPTAAELCGATPKDHWEQLQDPPIQADAMMDTKLGERSIRELLALGPTPLDGNPRSQAWFRSESGMYRYCRFVPGVHLCIGPTTVAFTYLHGRWQSEGPLVTVCVTAKVDVGV